MQVQVQTQINNKSSKVELYRTKHKKLQEHIIKLVLEKRSSIQ